MKAQDLAALSISPEALQRRKSYVESMLQEILQACRKAATDGQQNLYFKMPKEYYQDFKAVLESLDYAVIPTSEQSAFFEVTISWADVVKAIRGR